MIIFNVQLLLLYFLLNFYFTLFYHCIQCFSTEIFTSKIVNKVVVVVIIIIIIIKTRKQDGMSPGVVELKVQKSVFNFGKQRYRAVSRFFVTVGHYRECRRYEPSRGVWGYSRPESFQIWRLRNSFFSTFHEICLRKNRPQI